jgi:hypothetical protein
MNTSYFAKSANKFYAVSIAGRSPLWYTGRNYKKLAPKVWFFKKYKLDGDEAFYREQYQKEVLDKLDPHTVYNELGENAVLLCWEKSGEFCHRHLVAEWLMKSIGITITELE